MVGILVALRITSRAVRNRILAVATLLAFLACIVAPLRQGGHEAAMARQASPTASHPDVCLNGDASPWRLIRALDGQMLLTRVNGRQNGAARLAANADVALLLASVPDGGSASVCASLSGPRP